MALYIGLILITLAITGFFWVRAKNKSSDRSTSESKAPHQSPSAPIKQTKQKAATEPAPSTQKSPHNEPQKATQKTAVSKQKAPVAAKKKTVRFSPNSPVIKQYETALNLQMIQAEKAGDEKAYIEIVKQNAVYMQACAMLQKGINAKDREQVRASLIKIRGLIPASFQAQHKQEKLN